MLRICCLRSSSSAPMTRRHEPGLPSGFDACLPASWSEEWFGDGLQSCICQASAGRNSARAENCPKSYNRWLSCSTEASYGARRRPRLDLLAFLTSKGGLG